MPKKTYFTVGFFYYYYYYYYAKVVEPKLENNL